MKRLSVPFPKDAARVTDGPSREGVETWTVGDLPIVVRISTDIDDSSRPDLRVTLVHGGYQRQYESETPYGTLQSTNRVDVPGADDAQLSRFRFGRDPSVALVLTAGIDSDPTAHTIQVVFPAGMESEYGPIASELLSGASLVDASNDEVGQ